MEMRQLGKTGLRVSALGFGASEINTEPEEFDTCSRVLNIALDEGVNVIDTAACYGVSEELIGKAVSSRRKEYYIFTKTGHASGIDLPSWDPRLVAPLLDRSLVRLRTDRVELLQLHSCSGDMLKQGDIIAALQKVRESGKTRFIGYSGDGEAAAYAMTCGAFDTLQTSLNIFDQQPIETILPLARKHEMGVICKRPIGNAVWRHRSRPANSFHHKYWDRMQVLQYDFLGDGEAAADTALRFTLSQDGVHTAIVGTKSPEHCRQNAAMLSAGALPEAQVQAIRERWKAVEASLSQ